MKPTPQEILADKRVQAKRAIRLQLQNADPDQLFEFRIQNCSAGAILQLMAHVPFISTVQVTANPHN